jgi:hypothetical protein
VRNKSNHSPLHAAEQSVEDLASRIGITAEHVVLESQQISEEPSERSHTIRSSFTFRNRLRGTEMAFTLFNDGYLSFRETRGGKVQPERSIDLRYLDPEPLSSRRVAKTALGFALSLLSLTSLTGALAYLAIFPEFTTPLFFVSLGAASVASWLFAWRTEERVSFQTRHGQAVVLTLIANFGCFRACRAFTQAITDTIAEMQEQNEQAKSHLLRDEIREHYRLSENGVISVESCSAAIRNTLSSFD